MATFKSFEDLDIWKKAIDLAEQIYSLASVGELSKDWGMKDQVRRSASPISNNIAEGFEYGNNRDFINFLRYAKGSTGEFRNQITLLCRVNLIDEPSYKRMYSQAVELGQSIGKLITYLKQHEQTKPKATHNNPQSAIINSQPAINNPQ